MQSTAIMITEQDLREQSSAKLARLGQVGTTDDGRVYKYARAGAVDLAPGKINTPAAAVANHVNLTAVATPAGSFSTSFTLGATAATADQYAEGYLNVNVAPGQGQLLKVSGNTAAALSTAITVNLTEPVLVAFTTSSKVSLYKNEYDSVIISAAAAALMTAGVANIAVTAAYYGWLQVGGYCSVLSDGIITKNAGAIVSASVNGAATIELAASVTQRIGTAVEATVDTQYYPLNLTIA